MDINKSSTLATALRHDSKDVGDNLAVRPKGILKVLDKKWHRAHRMSKNATLKERIQWHTAHAKRCACRPIPASLKAAIQNGRK